MPRLLKMPSLDRLPAGPRRDFVAELHMHFGVAGRPAIQRIVAEVKNLGGDPVSRETVRRLLTGEGIVTWPKVESVLRALCLIAGQDPDRRRWPFDRYNNDDDDDSTCRAHLLKLWNDNVDNITSEVQAAPPSTGNWGGTTGSTSGWGASAQRAPQDDPWAPAPPATAKNAQTYPEEPPF